MQTCAIAAPFAKAWDLFTRLPDPRARLWGLLDTWAGVDEATCLEANVKALFDDIMGVFQEHPEAEAWFRAWRLAHPGRLV